MSGRTSRSTQTILGAIAALLFLLHGAASAQSAVTLRTDDAVTWVEGDVSTPGAQSVVVAIYAPDRDDGRRLYQRCAFAYSGAGTYGCGIATREARAIPGEWATRVLVDGIVEARRRFQP